MCHRAERTNVNRRFYSKSLLEREVADYTSQARRPLSHHSTRATAAMPSCSATAASPRRCLLLAAALVLRCALRAAGS